MAQEREIATRLRSLDELKNIVAAIRAIAASQMQQALRSLEAIRKYSEMIREALSDAAELLPGARAPAQRSGNTKSAIIVFCAEHGLCGGFNEQLLQHLTKIGAKPFVLIVVGSRGGQISHVRGRHRCGATRCGGGIQQVQRRKNHGTRSDLRAKRRQSVRSN